MNNFKPYVTNGVIIEKDGMISTIEEYREKVIKEQDEKYQQKIEGVINKLQELSCTFKYDTINVSVGIDKMIEIINQKLR